MKIKIFTITFNTESGIFEDKDVQDFLLNKRIVGHQAHFFSTGGKPYFRLSNMLSGRFSPFTNGKTVHQTSKCISRS
jgi:hypothetical protein